MLKSDLRGIETAQEAAEKAQMEMLKSDLRGIETQLILGIDLPQTG